MNSICFFVDLDNTLFQTQTSCDEKEGLEVAALTREGAPLSFSTSKQRCLFQWLCSGGVVIPITGRNYNSFSRVILSFPSKMAILDFGGVVLNEQGELDLTHHNAIKTALMPMTTLLEKIIKQSEQLVERYHFPVRPRLISDFGLSFYLEFKSLNKQSSENAINDDFSKVMEEELFRSLENSEDFYLHRNRNHFAILPKIVSKARALHYVMEQYIKQQEEKPLCIGIGDSLSDLPFMMACDYSMSPSQSQIAKHLSNLPDFEFQEK